MKVGFYNVNGSIYFGEMTFAPGSGYISKFESKDYDLWMGQAIATEPGNLSRSIPV